MIATSPPVPPPVAPPIEPGPPRIGPEGSERRRAQGARTYLARSPGRLRLASAVLVLVLVVLWIVAAASLGARRRATNQAGVTIEPLLVATQDLYTSLADADASAANAFLSGGIEPPAQRQRYVNDINEATGQLPAVARAASGGAAQKDVQLLNAQIPAFAGLVETARANNRLGFPVGAAYLRQASTLMRTQILPAANRVYQVEDAQLQKRYTSAGAAEDTAGVAVAGIIALAVLVGTQAWVARRSHRLLNLPLVGATVGAVVLVGWTMIAFSQSHHALASARSEGSDPVEVLSRARALTLQAEGDENLTLVARGTGDAFVTDFEAVTSELGGTDGRRGLLAQASRLTAGQPTAASDVTTAVGAYVSYLSAHTQVRQADDGGNFTGAVTLAVGPAGEYPAFVKFDTALRGALATEQAQFRAHASDARSPLDAPRYGIPILAVLAAALALAGIQQRINDYR